MTTTEEAMERIGRLRIRVNASPICREGLVEFVIRGDFDGRPLWAPREGEDQHWEVAQWRMRVMKEGVPMPDLAERYILTDQLTKAFRETLKKMLGLGKPGE